MKNTTAESAIETKPHYEILDGLRGVAAALVVAYHLFETYSGGDHTRQIINHGYLAVDFFFVLSGFVIGYAYDDRWGKGMSAWTFLRRRLVRLHPMLVLGTLVGAAFFYFQTSDSFPLIAGTSPWKMLLVTAICLTALPVGKAMDIRGWGETNPLNGPVWSLQWEYLANILYATVVRRFGTKLLSAFVAVCGVLTILLCFDIDLFGVLSERSYAAFTVIGGWALTPDQLLVGATRLLYPFFAGLLLSRLGWIVHVKRGGFAIVSAIVVAALAMPYFAPAAHPWVNGLYEAVAILLLFPLAVSLGAGSKLSGETESRICRFLGDLSYPLYITHFPFVYMQNAWVSNHPNATLAQNMAVSVSGYLIAVAVAYAALKLYDLPVRKWLARGLKK